MTAHEDYIDSKSPLSYVEWIDARAEAERKREMDEAEKAQENG